MADVPENSAEQIVSGEHVNSLPICESKVKMNPLMIAAERGDSNVVNFLLKSGFNVNEKVNEKSAVDLAWDNQHFEVVLQLLRANSSFPRNFEIILASDEIKEFVSSALELRSSILKGNLVQIEKMLKTNPNLHHFYSIKNVSAPTFALLNRKFDVYEFLIANGVYIGPDENVEEIFSELSKSRCKNLKKVHLKYLKNFKESHLIILALNSRVNGDAKDADGKMEHVRKAFKFLDQVDPFISLILQIVAASRDFEINFDFNSSTSQHADLKIDSLREINIAAADLLDSSKVNETYGTIAHELCHYAMQLVFKNHGHPYYSTDDRTRKMLSKISSIYEASRVKDELINSMYAQKVDMTHAELISKVPQMMVKYFNDPIKMEECRSSFSELFKFCADVIESALKHKLPTIKSSTEEEAQKIKISNRKQSKILAMLLLTLPLAIWLAVILTKPYIEPIYSCGNLTDELRVKILESTVDFQGINVIFGDLFGRNRSACEHLGPQDITKMLKVFDSGKTVENYSEIYKTFDAKEIEAMEERGFSYHDGDFKKFALDEIEEINMKQSIYEELNPNEDDNVYLKYMKRKFREPSLKVHKKVDLRSKFYVERWMKFQKFNYIHMYFSKRFFPMTFIELSKTKLLLLSDKGGSGKTTYFRHMAWKLKRRFPLKWISYVDLKQHIDVLQNAPKSDANVTTLVDFLSIKILNLTSKVDVEVFERKFLSNDSIFVWDAVDEISPMSTNGILSLIGQIKNFTGNRQWMSTRTHLEQQITETFGISAHKLDEYNEADKQDFVVKFLEFKNLTHLNATKVTEAINNFSVRLEKRTEADKYFIDLKTSPMILLLICESYAKNLELSGKANLYTIYEDYILKIFQQVAQEKGEAAKEDFFKVTELGLFRKIHQSRAIFQLTRIIFIDVYTGEEETYYRNMEIQKSFKNIKDEELLRFGIVYSTVSVSPVSNGQIFFEHQTLKEFFIAQYFHKNVWDYPLTDGSPRDEEVHYRLRLLFYVFYKSNSRERIVCDFIFGFIEAYADESDASFDAAIKDIMLTNYPNLLHVMGDNFIGIGLTTKFFKKDRDIISELWKINQNRTFFHEFFEKTTFFDDVAKMTKIIDENFNEEDRKQILQGKHQAANFLRMSWQKRMVKNHTIAFIEGINFKCDVESLIKIKTFGKFMEFLEAQNYTRKELREFFVASPNTKALKTLKDTKILVQYAKKLLSAQDFSDVTQTWASGWEAFDSI